MIRIIVNVIFVLLTVGYSAHAFAENEADVGSSGFSYSYISLDYLYYSRELKTVPDSLDGDGFALDLSYAIRPHVALTAGYNVSEATLTTSGVLYEADIDSYRFGLLIHAAINEKSDFIVGASFINGNADVSVSDGNKRSIDEDGGMTTIGFRALAYDSIEFSGFIRKNSIEDSSNYSISVAASYYAGDKVSIDLGSLIDSEGDSTLLSLGLTRYF